MAWASSPLISMLVLLWENALTARAENPKGVTAASDTDARPTAAEGRPPLVVDLDGTLTRTDSLIEGVLQLLRERPSAALSIPLWLLRGRASFKAEIARRVRLAADSFTFRSDVLAYLRDQKKAGRRLVLATASHRSIADRVARHLGLFDDVIATDGRRNLKGRVKLDAIRRNVGPEFSYAGDSVSDLPVWQAARTAVMVDVPAWMEKRVAECTLVERTFRTTSRALGNWVKAIRVHQWAKNLLLFVPAFTAFVSVDLWTLVDLIAAFLSFSLAASSTYIVNDIVDIPNDRRHPRKQHRPFACGALKVQTGLAVACVLLVVSAMLALQVGSGFAVLVGGYLLISTAYSWVLKRYILLDVLTLALLYTWRIMAGAVAASVAVSDWLLAFAAFAFLSLALVKRCAELVTLRTIAQEAAHGRDYRVSDLAVLYPMGAGAAVAAVVVFGLFINSAETHARYASPVALWFSAVGLMYWLGRLWIKTGRGEMEDDPMVYALRDRGSRMTIIFIIAVAVLARYLSVGIGS